MIAILFIDTSPSGSGSGVTSPVSFREERAIHYAIARIAEMEHREEVLKSPPPESNPSPLEKLTKDVEVQVKDIDPETGRKKKKRSHKTDVSVTVHEGAFGRI